jgi:o-succinylbenzoate---CoA ligase
LANFLCPIHQSSQHFPKSIALFTDEKTYTYQDLDLLIQGLCHELVQRGMKKDQRVAFLAKNTKETILLFFALFRLKAIACPLSPRLPPQRLQEAIEQLDAHFFLDLAQLNFENKTEGSVEPFEEEQMATFLFTSGTTAAPKIACHSLGNHIYSALGSNTMTCFSCSDCWLLSLPLYHVGGIAILFRSFFAGGKVALSEEKLSSASSLHPITFLSCVPTQLLRLLEESPSSFSQLKCILLGGAPIPSSLYAKALNRKLPIRPTYGMTEMSSQITMDIAPSAKLTAGTPLPFSKISLSKDGEILVRGKTLFQGYWDKDSGLKLELDEEGWFATKDLGVIAEGSLIYQGRKDHLFISGGENIQPEEIENALLSLEGIMEAIVVPSPDAEFGARPAAFIRDETSKHTLKSIQEALKPLLPSFKIPIAIYPIPAGQENLKQNRPQFQELASQFTTS